MIKDLGLEAVPSSEPCCPPPRAALSGPQAEAAAAGLKALADPVRLRLLSLVASQPDGEACACDLGGAFQLSQPTISHHLKVLHEAGLLHREKRGVWAYYRVDEAGVLAVTTVLGGLVRG